MKIYEECFKGLTTEEAYCASMCESIIAYMGGLRGYSDRQYLTKYRVSLGDKRVEEIFNTLKSYIDENYVLHTNVYTDCEGCSYNSFVKKGEKS